MCIEGGDFIEIAVEGKRAGPAKGEPGQGLKPKLRYEGDDLPGPHGRAQHDRLRAWQYKLVLFDGNGLKA